MAGLKKIEHIMFIFFLQLFSETFHILRRIQRDTIKNLYGSSCKVPGIRDKFLTKILFSRQSFETLRHIKFDENSSILIRAVPSGRAEGRTDMHDEANSRFPQSCERAQKS
jgi:hypothetical protein